MAENRQVISATAHSPQDPPAQDHITARSPEEIECSCLTLKERICPEGVEQQPRLVHRDMCNHAARR